MIKKSLFMTLLTIILITGTNHYADSVSDTTKQYYKSTLQKQNLGIILKAPFLHQDKKPTFAIQDDQKWKYHYNTIGLLTKVNYVNKKDFLTMLFIYNKSGQLIKLRSQDIEHDGERTFKYNSKGQIESVIGSDKKNKYLYEMKYYYDSTGKLTNSKYYNDRRKFFATDTFFYYENGLLRERRFHFNVMSFRRKGPIYYYNKSNELVMIKGNGVITTYQYE